MHSSGVTEKKPERVGYSWSRARVPLEFESQTQIPRYHGVLTCLNCSRPNGKDIFLNMFYFYS
jgi:hypothetical protein